MNRASTQLMSLRLLVVGERTLMFESAKFTNLHRTGSQAASQPPYGERPCVRIGSAKTSALGGMWHGAVSP